MIIPDDRDDTLKKLRTARTLREWSSAVNMLAATYGWEAELLHHVFTDRWRIDFEPDPAP